MAAPLGLQFSPFFKRTAEYCSINLILPVPVTSRTVEYSRTDNSEDSPRKSERTPVQTLLLRSLLPQHFNPGPRYLTTRSHYLRTVGRFVLDHVLQRANGYISRFFFRFAPFSSIDRTPISPQLRTCVSRRFAFSFFDPAFSSRCLLNTYCSGVGMQTGRGREDCVVRPGRSLVISLIMVGSPLDSPFGVFGKLRGLP